MMSQEIKVINNGIKKMLTKRLTDALDDYELRQSIDNEIKSISHDTKTTIDKMNSTTPTMGIGVEYESTYTDHLVTDICNKVTI